MISSQLGSCGAEAAYYYLTAYLFIDLHVIVTASISLEEIIIAVLVENNWNKWWDVLDEMA